MRSYSVAVASLAIDAPVKWTDNVLSQHGVPGVQSDTRGVARRIPDSSLIVLSIGRQLHTRLGLGVADALRVAAELLNSHESGVVEYGQIRLAVDLTALRREVDIRLLDALESAPTPRRGRPPGRSQV